MCCCCNMITKLELTFFVFFHFVLLSSVLSQNCDKFPSSSDYRCIDKNPNAQKCTTYAILGANSHYSSLSNLTSFLSIPRNDLLEANAFSPATPDVFSRGQPILIPIECKCGSNGLSEAEVRKISVKGDSFFDIAESLEGLASCSAIGARNPTLPPWNIPEGKVVAVAVKCACPSLADSDKFLLTYPVKEGDTLPELSLRFNVSEESLVSANAKYSTWGFGFGKGSRLAPLTTLVIPLREKPVLGVLKRRRKRKKMWMIGVYAAMGVVGFLACVGVGAAFFFMNVKKMKRDEDSSKMKGSVDLEVQQHLSLSIRTTSDKKVSFEGSQYNLDVATTPHKMMLRFESYAFDDLHKATEGFSSANLIGGAVYHGRFKGKNMAIKRVPSDLMSKLDYDEMMSAANHRHPNIIALLGICSKSDSDSDSESCIVFEYAENGSLKEWIHGGLAMKSHFIASCSCFLTWNQRLKICLDTANALQHMHQVMNPVYIHGSISSRNIFLAEDFTAKVGDFGMARLGGDDDRGYAAPEGAVSTGADVFAYGVVVLEVLSGKPPVRPGDARLSEEIKRVLQAEDAEVLKGWMDGALGETYCFDAAVMLANLARSCVDDDAAARPSAGDIVERLLGLVEELPEKEELGMCESSCKPLVTAAAT